MVTESCETLSKENLSLEYFKGFQIINRFEEEICRYSSVCKLILNSRQDKGLPRYNPIQLVVDLLSINCFEVLIVHNFQAFVL